MLQIGYFSSASGSQDARVVHNILTEARKANRRDAITGLLLAGGGRYLQVIEGPEVPVADLYSRIRKDPRHLAVATFLSRSVTERSFGSWSMAFRRPGTAANSSIFTLMLYALTAEVADLALKHQVRHFAGATMMMDESSSFAPGALDTP